MGAPFTYSVTALSINPVNFNLIATINYTDGSNIFSEQFILGVPDSVAAAQAAIDAQAALRINNVLIPLLTLVDPQTGIVIKQSYPAPAPPVVDPKKAAVNAAAIAFRNALQPAQLAAQVAELNKSDVTAAYDAYTQALADAASALAQPADSQAAPVGP